MDKNSRKVISTAKKITSDQLYEMVTKALYDAECFLNQPKEIVIPKLVRKLERAALEHGDPTERYKTQADVRKEEEEEFIDLIGYKVLRKSLWPEK